jgi:hypothetical protein
MLKKLFKKVVQTKELFIFCLYYFGQTNFSFVINDHKRKVFDRFFYCDQFWKFENVRKQSRTVEKSREQLKQNINKSSFTANSWFFYFFCFWLFSTDLRLVEVEERSILVGNDLRMIPKERWVCPKSIWFEVAMTTFIFFTMSHYAIFCIQNKKKFQRKNVFTWK